MASAALNHFLDLDSLETDTLRELIGAAGRFKAQGVAGAPLAGRTLVMIFEKPSMRTRVSFDVAMYRLGGHSIVLGDGEIGLGERESIADTARVLSRYADVVMLRTHAHRIVEDMAAFSDIPVINGLTRRSHPCQVLADLLTLEERKGSIEHCRVAWVGDGNNVAVSWIHAAGRLGFELVLACPDDLAPQPAVLAWAKAEGGRVSVTADPAEAVSGADCVVTDAWVSMGDEDAERRHALLTPYRVDEALMEKADAEAIFLHCLPAHRGEEVTSGVIDGPRSAVFDEAENRLHAHMAVLAWCLAA